MLSQRSSELGSILRVSADQHVSAAGADYTREKIGRALEFAPEPVESARVRLTGHPDPAMANPIVAQANVHTAGRTVRVQVAASTTREAIDGLADRLKTRLQRLARHWEAARGRRTQPGPHEWRHGDMPRRALSYFPRPVEQREVIRRKTFTLAAANCDEAAFDMELMDYDFHLFTEVGTGQDSVLYRGGRTGYRLAQLNPRPTHVESGAVPVTVSLTPPPVTDLAGAIERLELTQWPFVFFHDHDLNRGCVLYHRYDGHYGLIIPAT
ncbi:ribosome hibernation promotion factor [Nocardia huaxiensis]|uniref:ribosome hibernation promotion factor n=1 Tax=Nocardia huaxiensis TaxID=2755382 RepID=UPI001E61E44A|nr:HPF/RaiA family ribosome-associated protein [Nocardia huaxiensis]UFS97949.1 HPF/RaiA family ribosome-associated protein [Nocardia huaxiensis]